ncbi:hypothetical protein BCR33DRAFT_727147 [Rhizoclosmatium globosum]|uniref:Threonyl/alanyl tRNA synthetase SAD domain-containing protein n=1 Tax=Rhizoclosmatium globosum TaxID=329046 RepID=A0A1Y2ARK4_9FUNG|nr:hypothetical protein BCR33DRAFT_727147 [Rhizoclosmatium globosum]|eukprot:ORY25094.1 hypothetical protein BCR33DRAFT_727147 [Rhizoclosmatium globosum]
MIATTSLAQSVTPTIKAYFTDSYCFDLSGAKVLAVEPHDSSDKHLRIILDRTIFHPQGGGQPSDTGSIIFPETGLVFNVEALQYNRDTGVISHIGQFSDGEQLSNGVERLKPGHIANLSIDEAARRTNCRLHSAGHFLDLMMKQVRPELVPGSGSHATGMSWVNYTGDVPAAERNLVRDALQEAVNKHLAVPVAVQIEMNESTMRRSIQFGSFESCECGGTHVRNSDEIGKINITKIAKNGKNGVRVSYTVE